MSLYIQLFLQLSVAALLGSFLGVERALAGKTAGLRTFALISMGSSLFVIISKLMDDKYIGITNLDPLRVASQIVVAAGFLGAGIIIFRQSKLSGLTTAAGMWVSAGIGMAVGFNFYALAIFATILTFVIFTILWAIEGVIKKKIKVKP